MLEVICDMADHFKPEQVQARLAELGHSISLTTVYRNLPLLIEAGIIRRASIQESDAEGGAWYEHIWGQTHHDHLFCSRCGARVEFEYPAIDVLQQAVAREHGFVLERHHMELVGVCPACQPKSEHMTTEAP